MPLTRIVAEPCAPGHPAVDVKLSELIHTEQPVLHDMDKFVEDQIGELRRSPLCRVRVNEDCCLEGGRRSGREIEKIARLRAAAIRSRASGVRWSRGGIASRR